MEIKFHIFSKFLFQRVAYDLRPRNIFENFPGMLGLPEGHTHFRQKQKIGDIFSKLCLHRVAYDLERLFKNLRGVAGPRSFAANIKIGHFHKNSFCIR